jgi:hypothetical protein
MRVENSTKTRVWEDSSSYPETSTKNAVQEFHLSVVITSKNLLGTFLKTSELYWRNPSKVKWGKSLNNYGGKDFFLYLAGLPIVVHGTKLWPAPEELMAFGHNRYAAFNQFYCT